MFTIALIKRKRDTFRLSLACQLYGHDAPVFCSYFSEIFLGIDLRLLGELAYFERILRNQRVRVFSFIQSECKSKTIWRK